MSLGRIGNNRGKIFDPVVSVEGWRGPCSATSPAAVHVDVTFMEARLGEEPDSKVRFKVAIKAAVIALEVSLVDPIKIIPASVDRGSIDTIAEKSRITKASHIDASATGRVSTGPIPINAALEASGNVQYQDDLISERTRTLKPFQTEQFKQGEKYCWSVTSRDGQPMIGKVWEALEEPRCQVKLTKENIKSSDCEIRIKVSCKREDIFITDVKLKDRDKLSVIFGKDNNLAVAEAVLKQLISERGLPTDNFSESYQDILISDTSISED